MPIETDVVYKKKKKKTGLRKYLVICSWLFLFSTCSDPLQGKGLHFFLPFLPVMSNCEPIGSRQADIFEYPLCVLDLRHTSCTLNQIVLSTWCERYTLIAAISTVSSNMLCGILIISYGSGTIIVVAPCTREP